MEYRCESFHGIGIFIFAQCHCASKKNLFLRKGILVIIKKWVMNWPDNNKEGGGSDFDKARTQRQIKYLHLCSSRILVGRGIFFPRHVNQCAPHDSLFGRSGFHLQATEILLIIPQKKKKEKEKNNN